MIVNCAAGTKVQPLSAGYYYVSGTNNYVLTPELAKIPADDIARTIADCKNITGNLRQRDQKIHLLCNGCNAHSGYHIHTFVIASRVINRERLEIGSRFAMLPTGKVLCASGVYDVDSGKKVYEVPAGYCSPVSSIDGYVPRTSDTATAENLADRGYTISSKGTPPASILYDFEHGVETRFDGVTDMQMWSNPAEIVVTSQDKFMIIRCGPTISKIMPPPKISAAMCGDAVAVTYVRNPFETYTAAVGVADFPCHPLARNIELLYEIVKDAIDREPHLALHLAEKPDTTTATIRFLQKYAPDPLVIELARVESDRIGVIAAKVDWIMDVLPKY